jgi:nucleoid-associated protein YgaU
LRSVVQLLKVSDMASFAVAGARLFIAAAVAMHVGCADSTDLRTRVPELRAELDAVATAAGLSPPDAAQVTAKPAAVQLEYRFKVDAPAPVIEKIKDAAEARGYILGDRAADANVLLRMCHSRETRKKLSVAHDARGILHLAIHIVQPPLFGSDGC